MSKCSSEISTRIEKYSKQTHVLWHVTPKNALYNTHTTNIQNKHMHTQQTSQTKNNKQTS